MQLKQKIYRSCNAFFPCPICMKDHFRVYLKVYWDEDDVEGHPDTDFVFFLNVESVFLSFNCKCLRCGFVYKREEMLQMDFDDDDMTVSDPSDFVVDYFKNLKDLKV